jgi:hypothetical protein
MIKTNIPSPNNKHPLSRFRNPALALSLSSISGISGHHLCVSIPITTGDLTRLPFCHLGDPNHLGLTAEPKHWTPTLIKPLGVDTGIAWAPSMGINMGMLPKSARGIWTSFAFNTMTNILYIYIIHARILKRNRHAHTRKEQAHKGKNTANILQNPPTSHILQPVACWRANVGFMALQGFNVQNSKYRSHQSSAEPGLGPSAAIKVAPKGAFGPYPHLLGDLRSNNDGERLGWETQILDPVLWKILSVLRPVHASH